jgi:MFS family permease
VGDRPFRRLLIAGGLLSLVTVSDAFIFLALEDAVDLGTTMFPLLFVGSAGVYMLAAMPVGVLADRIGRRRVLLGGYAVLALVYAALLSPLGGTALVVLVLGGLGLYYAATDGVLMALGSALVGPDLRGSGLALLQTQTGIAKLFASIGFGAAWALWGMTVALTVFGVALLASIAAASIILRPSDA